MSFASDIEKWTKDFEKDTTTIIKEATKEVFTNIVDDSPVESGQFIAQWHVNQPDTYFQKGLTTIPSTKMNEVRTDIDELTDISTIELDNPAPYAELLEYGSSTQAPQGMVRINMMKWNSIMEKKAKEIYK